MGRLLRILLKRMEQAYGLRVFNCNPAMKMVVDVGSVVEGFK